MANETNPVSVNTHATPSFPALPVELILRIIYLVAFPEFTSERNANPYTCALELCLVSSAMRRIAMPILLHTVVLTQPNAQAKFVRALRLQKEYASSNHRLFIDYINSVCRMWIVDPSYPPSAREILVDLAVPPLTSSRRRRAKIRTRDLPIMAPMLLSVPSLAVDSPHISVLYRCLKWAWQNQTTTIAAEKSNADPSPSSFSATSAMKQSWRTTTLTLSGDLCPRLLAFTNTPEGSAFLAHIPSLILLGEDRVRFSDMPERDWQHSKHDPRRVPHWARNIPWSSFRSLRNITIPVFKIHRVYCQSYHGLPIYYPPADEDVDVKILRVEAPSDADPAHSTTKEWVRKAFEVYTKSEEGTLAHVEMNFEVGDTDITFDWETCWANGYVG